MTLKKKIIAYFEAHPERRIKRRQLARILGVGIADYDRFKNLLDSMSNKGEIKHISKSTYAAAGRDNLLEGTLQVTSRGFGFVSIDESADVFIPADDLGGALDGDIVKVQLYSRRMGPNPEGKITGIISRKRTDVVGTLRREKGKWFLIPDERSLRAKIPVVRGIKSDAKNGKKAIARILEPVAGKETAVEISRIIGFPDEPGVDFIAVCASYNLRKDFPQSVTKEVKTVQSSIIPEEIKRRLDLRKTICFTIDPADARDFDDAISIRKLRNGNISLGVHIADVSHYVTEGSALDREARRRCTSVYLINNVVPMLPERLSNEICSLNPHEDRLTMSVLMELDAHGELVDSQITPSVIRSKHRFTYHNAQEVLDRGKGKYSAELTLMRSLAEKLYNLRKSNGSIDFDFSESVFRLDENGKPYDVFRSERLDTHRLIEEFMLLANKIVATEIARKRAREKLPFIYRVHDKPKSDEVSNFLDMLGTVGVKIHTPLPLQPSGFRDILETIQTIPERDFLEKIALRAMAKATYSSKNLGHFALAFKYYTHFTSPIRRYPDLIVHRLLKEYRSPPSRTRKKSLMNILKRIAAQSTESEINAVTAEREFAKIKEVKFLAEKIGDVYEGVISGVTSFGLFVELLEFPVEGLVHIKDLHDDYYQYEHERYRLKGRRKGKIYTLGDKMTIQVMRVDVAEREVEFSLLRNSDEKHAKRRRR